MDLNRITIQACEGTGCSGDEALCIASEKHRLSEVMSYADKVRETHFGNRISCCAIINARSGACREDCRFCAQSAHHNTGVEVYPLSETELLVQAAAEATNVSTFGIVTSGPVVSDDEVDSIAEAVSRIDEGRAVRPCASLGSLSREQFAKLKGAGLRRFHHNLETSERFFPEICTTHTWQERVDTIRAAQDAGLEVCSGGLFGLGESWEDRVELALVLRELGIESVPVNFLNPVHGTPLADRARLEAGEGLRIISLYRFLLPTATIRVCGGRPTTLGERQKEMFRAGANAIMTGDYLTTSGISPETDRQMIEELGFVLDACH